MNDPLRAMEAFVRVVDAKSFSAAAKTLGTTQSNVSRAVRSLEEHLAARLLIRTTRRLSLTAEGQEYLDRARRILSDVEHAQAAVGRRAKTLEGTLRVFAPVSLGRRYVLPGVSAFLEEHRKLDVVLLLDDRPRDLVEERIDVAVRVGPQRDSTETAVLLGKVPYVLAASRKLVRRGRPKSPRELAQLEAIVFDGPIRIDSLELERGGERTAIALRARLATNSSEAMLTALTCGLGWAPVPLWLVKEELRRGELVALLEGWSALPALPVYAVYPPQRTPTARVRKFAESLSAVLKKSGIFEER